MSPRDCALDEFFARHYDEMVAWCRRRVSVRLGEPEEFVHEAYLRCARRWNATRRSVLRPAAYLRRATR